MVYYNNPYPGIPTTIKTMGVNITTIVYLRVSIIQIGSTIVLMVVEAQGLYNWVGNFIPYIPVFINEGPALFFIATNVWPGMAFPPGFPRHFQKVPPSTRPDSSAGPAGRLWHALGLATGVVVVGGWVGGWA